MIRPFTVVTFMMACGSGLYLYQSKHEVQMLDKTINQAERDISMLRDQSRALVVEWAGLNEPERLRKFSEMYLPLKPTLPSQYASLADLDVRLPPPRSEAPSDTLEDPASPGDHASIIADPDATIETASPTGANDTLPIPPMPSAPPPAPVTRPERRIAAAKPTAVEAAPSRPASVPDQHVAETRAPRPPDHVSDPRPVELHPSAPPQPLRTAAAVPRPLPTSPLPAQTARPSQAALTPQPTPTTGSLLGMARGAVSLPAPRPMPVNATNWYSTN